MLSDLKSWTELVWIKKIWVRIVRRKLNHKNRIWESNLKNRIWKLNLKNRIWKLNLENRIWKLNLKNRICSKEAAFPCFIVKELFSKCISADSNRNDYTICLNYLCVTQLKWG